MFHFLSPKGATKQAAVAVKQLSVAMMFMMHQGNEAGSEQHSRPIKQLMPKPSALLVATYW